MPSSALREPCSIEHSERVAAYGIAEVDGPRGRFVIRAEEAGAFTAVELAIPGAMAFVPLVRLVRRLIRREGPRDREEGWVVAIRRRADDPDGPVVYQETLPSKEAALGRLDELEREWRRPPVSGA